MYCLFVLGFLCLGLFMTVSVFAWFVGPVLFSFCVSFAQFSNFDQIFVLE